MKMNRAERMKLNAKAETEDLVTVDIEPSTHDTQSTHDTPSKQDTHDTQKEAALPITGAEFAALIEQSKNILSKVDGRGRPRKAEEDKLRGYRYNLSLDRDLKEFLHDVAWEKRTSITQYINDLIRADMLQHQAGGEVNEGTEDS